MASERRSGNEQSARQVVWLSNLKNSLRDRPVAILHGNVRDLYIDEKRTVHPDLTALLRSLAEQLSRERAPFSEIIFYDCTRPERRVPLGAGAVALPGGARPGGTSTASPGLLDDDGDAPRPPSQPGPTPGAGQPIPDPRTVIARWLRDLCNPQNSRVAVLYYLDKLIPYSTGYQENERQLLVWLEKLIDKITPSNRLVLVALQDTLVPVELYTNAPKAFVQAIPMPDADDREAYLRHKLENATSSDLGKDRFAMLGNLTDGLFLRDLDNIAASIRQAPDFSSESLRRILNQYRFGVQKDFFGQLSTEKIDGVVEWFESDDKDKGGVKGQTEAIERIGQMLKIARAGLAGMASGTASKPKGALFFAGPSGVGKTLVAKKLARFLFDDENAYLRFDMSEFKEEHTVSKLIGSPPGYVGSEQGGMLTNGVRQKPFSVVLFDEIEKAHAKIMDIFLQILDEGRLTDSRGQTVFFTETIIIFTSNIGTRAKERDALDRIQQDGSLDAGERKRRLREHFHRCVEEFFQLEISRPELLNRFGRNIIPFNPIDAPEIQVQIFRSILKRIKAEIEDKYRASGHRIVFDEAVPAWLAKRHGKRVAMFGGRGAANCLEEEVVLPLSESLLRAEDLKRRAVEFRLAVPEKGNTIEVLDGME